MEQYIVFKTSASIKARTQTSTEMGISCQRNGHWAATNYLSGRDFVHPMKELSSVAGRCAGRGCALIRQLANTAALSSIFKNARFLLLWLYTVSICID